MPSKPDSLSTLLALKLPPRDLGQLSFCSGNKPAHLQNWLDQLPLTQARLVSTHLYRALPELARLQTAAENRIELLDILWEPSQYCLTGLAKDFLNQPVILPEAARKTATLAQALQKHTTNGWLVALCELLSLPARTDHHNQLVAFTIHRALTSLAAFMLRSWQLYIPVAPSLWHESHLLYRLADDLGMTRQAVTSRTDSEPLQSSIEQLYGRLLLLASARPNQLRQNELNQVWNALKALDSHISLLPFDGQREASLFVVDIAGNQPPSYKSRQKGTPTPFWREPDIAAINQLLADLSRPATDKSRQLADNPLLNLRPPLSAALLNHLNQAWNVLARRAVERQTAQGVIEVTIGLSNLHYHLSGKRPFDVFLEQVRSIHERDDKPNHFQQRGITLKPQPTMEADDPWGKALDVAPLSGSAKALGTQNIDAAIRQHQQQEYQGHHPIFTVPLLDVSAGGYCLEWQGDIPSQVKAGELLGLKETEGTGWCIGVIRWVQQTPGATQLGIQVLAPLARPVALANVHKTGDFTEYLRGLQLPARKALNQPGTLITNAVSFRELNKIRLFAQGGNKPGQTNIEQSLQLLHRQFATGAFSQFTFRAITSANPNNGNAPEPQKSQ